MKNFLILALVFSSLFNIVYAGTYVSIWDSTFGELTINQEGSQATGNYTFGGDSSIVGTFEKTPEGLVLSGYWREPDTVGFPLVCGPDFN